MSSPTKDHGVVPSSGEITSLLRAWAGGDSSALNQVFPDLYAELKRIAERHLRSRQNGMTLESSALVHEAYLRISHSKPTLWQNRAHFFAVASTMIRGILVDHLRSRRALKRGGDEIAVTLEDVAGRNDLAINPQLLDVDTALTEFSAKWPRAAAVVELRFFGGLSESETASSLGYSLATVKRDWQFANAWIRRRLTTGG